MNVRTRQAGYLMAVAVIASGTLGLGQMTASADGAELSSTLYTETNAADGNRVLAYRDTGDGSLELIGSYATGGQGSGDNLGSQGAVVLSQDEKFLFAVNAGSDSVTGFAVRRDGSLARIGHVPSGGDRPVSVTAGDGVAYVVHAGSLDVTSLPYAGGRLVAGSPRTTQPLSAGSTAPGQVGLTPDGRSVVVSEKTNSGLEVFRVNRRGALSAPVFTPSTGTTPFGFDFTDDGLAVVSEAASTSVETFDIRRSGVARTIDVDSNGGQAAPCWLVVTDDGIAYTANAGGSANSISRFRVDERGGLFLLESRAAATNLHPTDMALGGGDTRLYNLSDRTGQIDASDVGADGALTGTAAVVGGIPTTITGLAATNG